MARGMSTLSTCALFSFAIASGAAFVMTLKLASLQTAVGLAGSAPHLFAHPLFQPFVKFFGASLWFVGFMAYSCFRRGIAKHELDLLAARNARDGENIGIDTPGFDAALHAQSHEPGARSRGASDASVASGASTDYSAWIFFLPATLDWFASSMAYVGLAMTDVTTFQMLRDVSMLCFVAAFSAVFTRKSLTALQLLAFVILICGAVLVYSASVEHTAPGNPQVRACVSVRASRQTAHSLTLGKIAHFLMFYASLQDFSDALFVAT